MIVRPESESLFLVTQPDHAALSGRIMAAWRADGLPTHASRDTVLLATRAHDNGWEEVDARATIDRTRGRPHDFITAPGPIKREIWPRGVARLEPVDPAAAALVAQHAITVLERHPSAAWRQFFTSMEATRDRILGAGAYGNRLSALRADYRMVYLGDLLSLIFCCGWQDPFAREGYDVVLHGTTLEVCPDPFDGRTIELAVRARRIPARRYATDAELHCALAEASAEVVAGTAIGCR